MVFGHGSAVPPVSPVPFVGFVDPSSRCTLPASASSTEGACSPGEYVLLNAVLGFGSQMLRSSHDAEMYITLAGNGFQHLYSSPCQMGLHGLVIFIHFHCFHLRKGVVLPCVTACENLISTLSRKKVPVSPAVSLVVRFWAHVLKLRALKDSVDTSAVQEWVHEFQIRGAQPLENLEGLMYPVLLFCATHRRNYQLNHHWRTQGQALDAMIDQLMTACCSAGQVVPWSVMAITSNFRAMLALKTDRLRDVEHWASTALNAFASHRHSLHLSFPILLAAVHTLDFLQRFGHHPPASTQFLVDFLMEQSARWPIVSTMVRKVHRDVPIPASDSKGPLPSGGSAADDDEEQEWMQDLLGLMVDDETSGNLGLLGAVVGSATPQLAQTRPSALPSHPDARPAPAAPARSLPAPSPPTPAHHP